MLRALHSRRGHSFHGLLVVICVVLAAICTQAALATGAVSGGWDVSWPQCTGSGVQALPAASTLGIVGINDGRPFTTNPCLSAEFQWAQSTALTNAALYLNVDDPGTKSASWPAATTARGGTTCVANKGSRNTSSCAFVYGWIAAADAWTRFHTALSAATPPVPAPAPTTLPLWLDVEAANSWQSSAPINTASISGSIAYLQSIGALSVGIYANRNDSHTIFTPSSAFPTGTLSWLATGETTQTGGLSYCGYPGFTQNGTALVQWWPFRPELDADTQCVGYVTGTTNITAGHTATGLALHLLHPAPINCGPPPTPSSLPCPALIFKVSGLSDARFATSTQVVPSASVTVTVQPGQSVSSTFSFSGTVAGDRDIIATCTTPGVAQCTSTGIATYASVAPGPAVSLGLSPLNGTVSVFGKLAMHAFGYDRYHNPTGAPNVSWSVTSPLLASVPPGPSTAETLTGQAVGTTTVTVGAPGFGIATSTVSVVAPTGRGLGRLQGGGARVAGVASAAMTTRVWAPVSGHPQSFTLHSSKNTGRFSLTPNGPWTSTLHVSIPVGQVVSAPWYSRERVAGTTVITAVAGATTITRSVHIAAAAPVRLVILPHPLRMAIATPARLQAFLRDAFGNLTRAVVLWTRPLAGTIRLQPLRAWNPLVVGVHPGVTRITARLHAFTATAVVIVTR